jgi:hypothetical protein
MKTTRFTAYVASVLLAALAADFAVAQGPGAQGPGGGRGGAGGRGGFQLAPLLMETDAFEDGGPLPVTTLSCNTSSVNPSRVNPPSSP